MSWLTPDTRALETQAQRNRIWLEWIKGAVTGAGVMLTLVISALNIWSRLQ